MATPIGGLLPPPNATPVTETKAHALRLPCQVRYSGKLYRAQSRLPVAELGGFALLADDEQGQRTVLLYCGPDATVLVVVE